MGNIEAAIDIFDRIKKWKNIGDANNTKLRLLYLEISKNLDVLNSIKLKKEKGVKFNAPDYLELIDILDTTILEVTFMESDSTERLFKNFKKFNISEIKSEYGKKDDNEKDKLKEPMDLLIFLYKKINSFKSLKTLFASENKALRNINFKVRLNNIKHAYSQLEIVLRQLINNK